MPLKTIVLMLGFFSCHTVFAAEPKVDPEAIFALKVYPILKSKCLACHGDDPEKLKGDLDLRTRIASLKGGASGLPGLVARKADESTIYRAIARDDKEVSAMPPKENDQLSQDERAAFKAWIDGGAPWPSDARIEAIIQATKPKGVRVKTSLGLSSDWTNRAYEPENLWAYQPLVRPIVDKRKPDQNPIDGFIEAKLRAMNLAPAPGSGRRELLRRASFDITGLPPTPEEMDRFLRDPRSDELAWTEQVDRLLASPHAAEQLARHWLDLTRYADSAGFANDYERGSAWRYRDYVVRSFQSDKPYDRFVMEQIAGDELAPGDPESLIAVGFLRMGPWELTGMEVARVARQRFLDDITDTVGQVFLGHMLQCARCHDHKFDPVPTRDYYRIQAVFATTQIAERSVPFLESENQKGFEEKRYLEARKKELEQELARIRKVESEATERWKKTPEGKAGQKPPRHEFLSPADLGMERIARKGLERLKWEFDRYEPYAHSVYNGHFPKLKSIYAPFRIPADPMKGEPESSHILGGGDPFSPRDPVTPGVLSIAGEAQIPTTVEGRRTALARWIANPKNPLTARVMANRIWQWTMGQPIAGNPNNFGATGKKPTYPELLDWLAVEFVENGWSIRHLQRLILTSDAYRRSSTHPRPEHIRSRDPLGISYAVHQPRRLAAEELRDAMLAVSGELNRELGGIPVRPEIATEIAHQPRQVMGTFAAAYEPSPNPNDRHRRTLYTLKQRGVRDPFLEVFNAPASENSCEFRDVSTVAPQVFALFNSTTSQARALALAQRVTKETDSDEAAITQLFRLAYGRTPSEKELTLCLKHWQAQSVRQSKRVYERAPRPLQLERVAVEENTGTTFRFVERLPAAADFVPDAYPADASARIRGLMDVCLVILNSNEFIYLD